MTQDKTECVCDQEEESFVARPEWTIMIYLAGDNNLSSNCIAILQELEAARHDRNVRIVAGFDSTTPWPQGARYVEIKRHLYSNKPHKMKWDLHNDLVQPGHVVVTPDFCNKVPGATSPTEPIAEEGLARFLRWAKKHYQADRYMLILFGHGTVVAGNTFLSDTTPPSHLRLTDFRRILNEDFGSRIDILAFNNCVMNGIETAVELRGNVDYTIGSQGLVLTVGWPYRKIINAMVDNYRRHTPKQLAQKVLRVCARNILDFSLMERSSEQAVCHVSKFGLSGKITPAVKDLSRKLQTGLSFHACPKEDKLRYPVVRDAVRLARLEAQSYWGETHVDLYDFCELLLARCNEFMSTLKDMSVESFAEASMMRKDASGRVLTFKEVVRESEPIKRLEEIANCCEVILKIFRCDGIVPRSYYVGPELQYSHGVSIYFPWTLPQYPITFEPVYGDSNAGEGRQKPKDYTLRTPFEEYKQYEFAKRKVGDWARFLEAFFRATLRDVRVVDYKYTRAGSKEVPFVNYKRRDSDEWATPAIDLQKSTSSTGEEGQDCPQIKNYPRRFYLSPADCKRLLEPVPGIPGAKQPEETEQIAPPGKVLYLGWHIRGLVAEVIGLKPLVNAPETPSEDCTN